MRDSDQTKNQTEQEESIIGLTAYPLLTTQVDLNGGGSRGGASSDGAAGGMEHVVSAAIREVLGWNPNPQDARGFTGALSQAFDLRVVEGHTEWTWKPRTFAVFTDLEGGVTGAQASVYTRAKDAVDRALPLMDGLYSLGHGADAEDTNAIRAILRHQLKELVGELGRLGGPRVARVDHIFDVLLGPDQVAQPREDKDQRLSVQGPDADQIGGELARLRNELELSASDDTVNTVEEEQNQTNYRILADYVIGLRLAWQANRRFFTRGSAAQPFFGTQLVHLSRQLAVLAESVSEVRFAFDSVFIGPRERQTLEVRPQCLIGHRGKRFENRLVVTSTLLEEALASPASESLWHDADPIFLEEALQWIESFAREEGPQVVKEAGKLGVQHAFLPVVCQLKGLVAGLRNPRNGSQLPRGYHSPRVKNALLEMEKQLATLLCLARPFQHSTDQDEGDGDDTPPPSGQVQGGGSPGGGSRGGAGSAAPGVIVPATGRGTESRAATRKSTSAD